MELILPTLSGLSIALSYGIFISGVLKGGVTLKRSSWIVWAIQDLLIFLSALGVGVGPAIVMPAIWTCGAAVMLIMSFAHGKVEPFTSLDKWCLLLGFGGMTVWMLTGSARIGLVASISSALIGGIPTTKKAFTKPWTDSPTAWSLQLMGTIFSFMAIKKLTFDTGFLPIWVGLYQAITFFPLFIYRVTKKENSVEQLAD